MKSLRGQEQIQKSVSGNAPKVLGGKKRGRGPELLCSCSKVYEVPGGCGGSTEAASLSAKAGVESDAENAASFGSLTPHSSLCPGRGHPVRKEYGPLNEPGQFPRTTRGEVPAGERQKSHTTGKIS